MLVEITITASSAEELRAKVLTLAGLFSSPVAVSAPQPTKAYKKGSQKLQKVEEMSSNVTTRGVAQSGSASGLGPDASQNEAPDSDVQGSAPNPVQEEKKYTLDDARLALTDLNAKKGIVAARALLQSHGCARISDLKEENFAAFIHAAKEALS